MTEDPKAPDPATGEAEAEAGEADAEAATREADANANAATREAEAEAATREAEAEAATREADAEAGDAPARAASARPTSERSTSERSLVARIFNLAVFAIGGVALVWMLRNQSWDDLRSHLAGMGWWFPILLAIELVSLGCDAAALHAFMRPEARMIPYWRVLGAQSSGRAINVLTPGGALGEPTKLTMLVSHAPRARVLSSLILLNLSQIYLSIGAMLIGIPITLLLVDLPQALKVPVGIGLAVILPATIALGVVIHRGAVSTVVGTLRRSRLISPARAERWKQRLIEVDRHIRELHQSRSAGTWKGILWVLLSKALTWTGTLLMLAAIGVPFTTSLVLGVLSIGVLISWISNIVPLGLGVSDGSNYVLLDFLGATGPHGLLVAMISRARSITVAFLGLGAMAVLSVIDRIAVARVQRKLRELRERAAVP